MTSLLDRDKPTPARFGPSPDEARMLLQVAFRPVGALLAVVALVVVVTLVSAGSDLTGTFGALAATWLAVHQVPLGIAGATLSILPLLPTVFLVRSVSSVVAKSVSESSTRRDLGWVVGAALAGPLAMSAVMLAMIHDASTVIALSTPNALATFGWVLLVHGVGVAMGCIRGTWPSLMRRADVPPWLAASFPPALRAGAVLLAGGAVVVAATLLMSLSTIGALLETGGGIGGALGLTAISLLYLPNAVVAAAGVATGSTVHAGLASASLFETTGGQVPAVPILAALPESSAQVWWPIMAVVPVVAAIVLGRAAARATATLPDAVRAAACASATVGVVSALAAVVAGGSVGTFGHFGVDAALVGLAAAGWLVTVGVAAALITAYLMRRHDEVWETDEHETEVPPVPVDEPAALTAGPAADEPVEDAAEPDEPAEPDVAEPSDDDVVDAELVELPAEEPPAGGASTDDKGAV